MRRFTGVIMLFFSCHLFSQQEYFVFIQEPARQPFYVRVGEESFSSSAGGHLIMAPVKDSVYSLYIGFPKNRYPEQLFTVTVNRDMGFELKNIDGVWQLFDLEGLGLIKPVRNFSNDTGMKRTDSYSLLMAGVVNDSSVLYTAAMKKTVTKAEAATGKEPDSAGKNADSVEKAVVAAEKVPDSVKKSGAVAENKSDPVQKAEAVAEKAPDSVKKAAPVVVSTTTEPTVIRDKRDIIKYETINVKQGKMMIYLDRTGPVTDTIRIIVPRL